MLTCAKAAGGGHLDVLQWARANGCPWDWKTCIAAAEGGHLDVLLWACDHGCPRDQVIQRLQRVLQRQGILTDAIIAQISPL
jgi:hypothetical protein